MEESIRLIVLLQNVDQTRPLFVCFRPFLNIRTIIVTNLTMRSIDSVIGIQTLDRRIVIADESTGLWWPLVCIVDICRKLT